MLAIITGGTSGIGLASAKLFLQKNYDVVLVARDKTKYEAVKAELNALCGDNICDFISADISKVIDCEKVIYTVIAKHKQIDALVNSAGIYRENAIDDVDEDEFDRIMNVNIKGTYFMCKYAVPYLKQSLSKPAIVNVSSDAGTNGNFFCTAYCASKGAVNTFTKALALELAPYGVRANCVCPGDIDTPLTRNQFADPEAGIKEAAALYPMGRIGRAEEVANAIYFLASGEATFITGSILAVDGGITAC